jgi:hypothetical protein
MIFVSLEIGFVCTKNTFFEAGVSDFNWLCLFKNLRDEKYNMSEGRIFPFSWGSPRSFEEARRKNLGLIFRFS